MSTDHCYLINLEVFLDFSLLCMYFSNLYLSSFSILIFLSTMVVNSELFLLEVLCLLVFLLDYDLILFVLGLAKIYCLSLAIFLEGTNLEDDCLICFIYY